MTEVKVTFFVNADLHEAWDIIDEWIGTTAPESVDSFNILIEPKPAEQEET